MSRNHNAGRFAWLCLQTGVLTTLAIFAWFLVL